MSGMKSNKRYKFIGGNSRIFLTGAPLSGKSTISPQLVSKIDDCTLQNMDILRLMAQMLEDQKPEKERNPFAYLGSCDAYKAIGDGTFNSDSLISGFREYSSVVCKTLDFILPKLEAQGAKNAIFEGVQLLPKLIKKHINDTTRVILVTTTSKSFDRNSSKTFGNVEWLLDRYSTDKLISIQNELVEEVSKLPKDRALIVKNESIDQTVENILEFLINSKLVIELKN